MTAPEAHVHPEGDAHRTIVIGEHTFSQRGGLLCVDFVNTVDNWYGPRRHDTGVPTSDYLSDYADLVSWARQVGAVSERSAEVLTAAAERDPERAEAIFVRAATLRTSIHDLIATSARGEPTPPADLAVLNAEIAPLLAASCLEPDGEAYVLARPGERDDRGDEQSLDKVLWPVLRSVIALFTSPAALARVRECPGEDCGWLFYDATGRRRWCSMASCGTRDKVRRFRARQRDVAPA